jgi:hypothetical protein
MSAKAVLYILAVPGPENRETPAKTKEEPDE